MLRFPCSRWTDLSVHDGPKRAFLAKRIGARPLVAFIEKTVPGDRVLAGLKQVAEQRRINVRHEERFPQGTIDFSKIVPATKPGSDEAAFFWGGPLSMIPFLKAWNALGRTPPLFLASPWGLRLLPQDLPDFTRDTHYFVGLDYPATMPAVQQALKEWEKEWKAKDPHRTGLPDLFVYGYAAAQLLIRGIASANTTDAKKVVEVITRSATPTLAGEFRFTPTTETRRTTYALFEVKGGGYVLAQSTGGGDCCPDYSFCCSTPPESTPPPKK
jgi:ABC-type branched-subunit amino acid transport system substrate-binding protein